LGEFYLSLLRSEARHDQNYFRLAREIAESDIGDRVMFFGQFEAQLITTPDEISSFTVAFYFEIKLCTHYTIFTNVKIVRSQDARTDNY
jgi:hypothetical protein